LPFGNFRVIPEAGLLCFFLFFLKKLLFCFDVKGTPSTPARVPEGF
jgi:hypothetical protein